jgi:hypothetical protein
MFIAYLAVTILTAAANIFSATLDFVRYKQILINMAKVGVPQLVDHHPGRAEGSGGAWTASWYPRSAARNGRCKRPCAILCWCHRHPSARTRLLVRSRACVPPAGNHRAGIAISLFVRRETLGWASKIGSRP